MKNKLQYVRGFYKQAIPLLVALRLVTLSTAGSLAVAASNLPQVDGSLAISNTLVPQAGVTNGSISIQTFLSDTNTDRLLNGLPALSLNDQLDAAATAKVQDMIQNNYWDHFRPSDGKAPWDFIKEAGYNYHYAGENLARGFQNADQITQAWMNSPEHRANVLSPHYTDIGFATGYMQYQGQEVLITDELFGSK